MIFRNKFDRSGAKGEKEEDYCLCGDEYGTTSFSDCYLHEKEPSSGFKNFLSKFKNYFKNRQEKKKEKFRFQQFQKLKVKLQVKDEICSPLLNQINSLQKDKNPLNFCFQKMYIDHQKKVKVNRREEKILNSLTEEERYELGEMIREMKFLLDSDEETERLLLSGKRQGTFIIDMKNLCREKIARSHESDQEIKSIKNCGSKERSSLSEDMMILCAAETNKSPQKKFEEANGNRPWSSSKHYLENEAKDYLIKKENLTSKNYKLDVKSEFVKCYTISDSDKNCSSPFTWERTQRYFSIKTNSNKLLIGCLKEFRFQIPGLDLTFFL